MTSERLYKLRSACIITSTNYWSDRTRSIPSQQLTRMCMASLTSHTSRLNDAGAIIHSRSIDHTPQMVFSSKPRAIELSPLMHDIHDVTEEAVASFTGIERATKLEGIWRSRLCQTSSLHPSSSELNPTVWRKEIPRWLCWKQMGTQVATPLHATHRHWWDSEQWPLRHCPAVTAY